MTAFEVVEDILSHMLSGWFFGVWQAAPEPNWGQADSDDEEDEVEKERKKAVVAAKAAEGPHQQSMMEKRFGNRAVREVRT